MSIKVVIFELDGVLCHLERYHYQSWKRIADELGIPFSKEQYRNLLGLSKMNALDVLLKDYSGNLAQAEKEILADERIAYLNESYEKVSEKDCDSDLEKILQELRGRGYTLAVASSNKNTRFLLRKINVQEYIDYVSVQKGNRRLCEETLLKICSLAHCRSDECIFVSAAEYDIGVAEKVGMSSVLWNRDSDNTIKEGKNSTADMLLENIENEIRNKQG